MLLSSKFKTFKMHPQSYYDIFINENNDSTYKLFNHPVLNTEEDEIKEKT